MITLISITSLVNRMKGNEDSVKEVYEWANGRPEAQSMGPNEIVKLYNDAHGTNYGQEKIEMGNFSEDNTENNIDTEFSGDAVDQVEDNTSNEAPQPIFAGYKHVQVKDFDEDEMQEKVEEEGLEDMDMVYKLNNQYFSSPVEGASVVPFAPVNDSRFKNYYITGDGILVRKVKKDGSYRPASVKKNRYNNLYIQKRDTKTKDIFYIGIGVLVYKTFIDEEYDDKVVLFADQDLDNLTFYNLNRKK